MSNVKVPKTFLEHPKIKHLFYHIVTNFSFAEKQAIYFHHFCEMPIDEIAELTQLNTSHINSVLSLYAERIACKVNFFKEILPHNPKEQISICEMLISENETEVAY
ncbi:MAG: hypothetical protein FWD97_05280 [Defluviitaleaceae bacterium]|nr:hypothetical protein [Defluviitaleaceae bacterium]